MRYYDTIRQAYDNGRERTARSEAEEMARSGAYDAASDRIMSVDPTLAQAYTRRADAGAAREVGQAVQAGEYNRANKIAGQRGDLDTIAALDQQQRMQTYRTVSEYSAELRDIDSMPEGERQGAFASMIQRARQRLQASGQDASWLDQIGTTYNPRLSGNLQSRLDSLRNNLLTPEQQATLEQRRADDAWEDMTPEEAEAAGFRPGSVVQRNASGAYRVRQTPLAPRTGAVQRDTLPPGFVIDQ